jgi:hypothetical protein
MDVRSEAQRSVLRTLVVSTSSDPCGGLGPKAGGASMCLGANDLPTTAVAIATVVA